MLYKYRRAARTHEELNLGPLTPLCEAIPELAQLAGVRVGAEVRTQSPATETLTASDSLGASKSYAKTLGVREELQRLDSNHLEESPDVASRSKARGSEHVRTREGTASARRVSEGTDPVVDALERGHAEAGAVRDWARAEILARELVGRERALGAANVVAMPVKKPRR